MGWVLAVHLGAGRYGATAASESVYLALLRAALATGRQLMQDDAADVAVTRAVHVVSGVAGFLERSELTNCGRGSNLTEHGVVECEASVSCGKMRAIGACAAVRGVAEPSALARSLLVRSTNGTDGIGREPPAVVVGDGAKVLARNLGLETAADAELPAYQVTAGAKCQWCKWKERCSQEEEWTVDDHEDDQLLDTVGVVCVDPEGNVAAAASSGGVLFKVPGRVGLAGCPRMGCDARNARGVPTEEAASSRKRKRSTAERGFAIACTGRGEHFVRSAFAPTLAEKLRRGWDVDEALRMSFDDARDDNGDVPLEGGALALAVWPVDDEPRRSKRRQPPDASSNHDAAADPGRKRRIVQLGTAMTTSCMAVGYLVDGAEPQVQILRQPDQSDPQLVVSVSCFNV